VERIARLIDGFETPYGMELLGSIDWVGSQKPPLPYDEIVRDVQAWNERKGRIMKSAHIKAAYDRLVAEQFLERPDSAA
jgi:hypothetical protein